MNSLWKLIYSKSYNYTVPYSKLKFPVTFTNMFIVLCLGITYRTLKHHDIVEILLKLALNTNQSINP